MTARAQVALAERNGVVSVPRVGTHVVRAWFRSGRIVQVDRDVAGTIVAIEPGRAWIAWDKPPPGLRASVRTQPVVDPAGELVPS